MSKRVDGLVKSYVRIRPVAGQNNRSGIARAEHRLLYLNNERDGSASEFVFEGVFEPDIDQTVVFREVALPLCKHVKKGFNACCFAYGVAGSGKTFSIFGREHSAGWELPGLVPQAAEEMLLGSQNGSAFMSFVEFCQDQARDLGKAAQASANGAKVADQPLDMSGDSLVKALTQIEVYSMQDIEKLLTHVSTVRKWSDMDKMYSRAVVCTISAVQSSEGQQPVTARLNMVVLPPSLVSSQSSTDMNAALGDVLQALSQGSGQAAIPYNASKLTHMLQGSLQPSCLISLLVTLHPTSGSHDQCLSDLQYALKCQGSSGTPSAGGTSCSASASPIPPEGLQELHNLRRQAVQQQQELDYTHAHYQKLIESVAGPGWLKKMGPLERGAGMPEDDGQEEVGAPMVQRMKSVKHPVERASDSSGLAGMNTTGGGQDAKVRRLEQQIEILKDRLATAEGRVQEIKRESEEFRDRMTGRDHHQFSEIKTLRGQVSCKTSEAEEVRAECAHQIEELKRRHESEVARLNKDAELLRNQLTAMGGSITNMMQTRSEKTAAEKRIRDAMQKDLELQMATKVTLVTQEKERQITNLKQQNNCILERKAEELANVRSELTRLQRDSQAEIAALQAESECLAAYSEKLTEIIRRMESGLYGIVDMGGLRSFKVPPRDKPGPLDPNRLKLLRQRVETVERLVEVTRQASAGTNGMPKPTSALGLSTAAAGGALRAANTPPDININSPSRTQGAESSLTGGNGSATLPYLQDLGQLRAQVEGELRGSITSQVVDDLKNEKTVEYIRSLESQVARYRQEVQAEKKRNAEMTVSLRSLQRLASRPGSPMNAALSMGTASKSPASWGWGHATIAATAASASSKLDPSRPATAF